MDEAIASRVLRVEWATWRETMNMKARESLSVSVVPAPMPSAIGIATTPRRLNLINLVSQVL
jgi:hypothetical protein